MNDLEQQVASLAELVLSRHGADLVDVQVKRGRTQLVRIVADQPGGIDLDTCAAVSTELSRLLDVEDPIAGRYTLEVTSPGLDRPLRRREDFERNVGRAVRVVLAGGERRGVVREADEQRVVLDDDGEMVEVALSDIVKATIELPW